MADNEHEVLHVCNRCFMQPGSDTARANGCTCAVLDNGHGHNTEHMSYSLDCPVHGFGIGEENG